MIESARSLLEGLNANGVYPRLLGGVAIAVRCPSARFPPLAREYHDVDLATDGEHAHQLSEALIASGFAADERFNNLHGRTRMMFTGSDGVHLDVLVDEFVMCHKLGLKDRLSIDEQTLPLGDLLLTKLQIAELNQKDVLDIAALVVDHPLTDDETGINQQYIVDIVSSDWGWWRTVTISLQHAQDMLPALGLATAQAHTAETRMRGLADAIAAGKRSFKWRMRARVGERAAWRFDPEEVSS